MVCRATALSDHAVRDSSLRDVSRCSPHKTMEE
jgi:hypothetical protein